MLGKHTLPTRWGRKVSLSLTQDTSVKINKMQLSSGREKSAAGFYYTLLDEVAISKSRFWQKNLLTLLQLFTYFLVGICKERISSTFQNLQKNLCLPEKL